MTSDDPAVLRTLERLAKARARMKQWGITPIWDGHKGGRTGWRKVNVMAEETEPAKVIPFQRRK